MGYGPARPGMGRAGYIRYRKAGKKNHERAAPSRESLVLGARRGSIQPNAGRYPRALDLQLFDTLA